MKKIYLFILFIWQVSGWSQDTTGYDLLAHYPFQTNATDATGNNPDATIQNAPFSNGSIYSNGTYNDGSTGQSGSLIVMDGINGFNAGDFIITFEAKLSSNTNNFIFISGHFYRWLNLWISYSHTLQVDYLTGANADFAYYDTNFAVTVDQWYQFGLKYTQSDHNLYVYVDNNLVGTVNIPNGLATDNEIYFGNTHGGAGVAYYGYWRHMKYYVLHGSSAVKELLNDYVDIYQSMNTNFLNIDLLKKSAAQLSIVDLTGKQILQKELYKQQNIINLSGISKGIYILKFEINNLKFTKKIIKR